MTKRDLYYVEGRLLAPAGDLGEAIARLRTVGEADLADRLMAALQALGDVCREVRGELLESTRRKAAEGGTP